MWGRRVLSPVSPEAVCCCRTWTTGRQGHSRSVRVTGSGPESKRSSPRASGKRQREISFVCFCCWIRLLLAVCTGYFESGLQWFLKA